jgi:hypothetical protein
LLTKRVEALEIALVGKTATGSKKDWRKLIGLFHDSKIMRQVVEECQQMREAEREATRHGESAE